MHELITHAIFLVHGVAWHDSAGLTFFTSKICEVPIFFFAVSLVKVPTNTAEHWLVLACNGSVGVMSLSGSDLEFPKVTWIFFCLVSCSLCSNCPMLRQTATYWESIRPSFQYQPLFLFVCYSLVEDDVIDFFYCTAITVSCECCLQLEKKKKPGTKLKLIRVVPYIGNEVIDIWNIKRPQLDSLFSNGIKCQKVENS